MRIHQTAFVLALFICAASVSYATEIPGSLTDAMTSAPIAGATIHATGPGLDVLVTTDTLGCFVLDLPDPPPPSIHLRVTAPGYQTLELDVPDVDRTSLLSLETRPSFVGEIEVTGLRATAGETPVSVANIDREQIERQYWAQDVPILLATSPGFYAYNDSGQGIGYSYFFLRGFDMRRTAVSINGVPLNDAHSHSLFFIDLADFLSTTGDIQIQRGVGTTLYGGSAIGGSIDLATRTPEPSRRLRLTSLGGSYGTSRFGFEYDTGIVDDHWAATFRYSRVRSTGYRDQSWVTMWNYYASIVRFGDRSTVRVNLFGGPEETHLAYEGVPRAYLDGAVTGDRRRDRRHNPLEYPNEIDHFSQPHYQLIHTLELSEGLALNNTFFFFTGDGFFQQYKQDRWMPEYGLDPIELPGGTVIDTTDLVRRREVDEWDGGWIPTLEWRHGADRGSLQTGAAIRLHSGRHFGFVQWAQFYPPNLPADHRYYDYRLAKRTVQPFVQENWRFNDRWNLLAGFTWTSHRYEMSDDRINGVEVDASYSYLLPRFGVGFRPSSQWSLYANASRGAREPAFRDIYDPQSYWSPPPLDLAPEKLWDFEIGAAHSWPTGSANLNLYYLDFSNAIVWAGGLDNNGVPVTANGAVTEHLGAELDVAWTPRPRWAASVTVALADHHIVDFTEYDYDGNEFDHSGNSLPVSPRWLGTIELRGGSGPVDGFVQIRFVDDFFLDNTEDMRKYPEIRDDPSYVHRINEAYLTFDLGFRIDLGATVAASLGAREMALTARINNLTDELFTTFGYFDGYQPVWIPGATRNGSVGLVLDW